MPEPTRPSDIEGRLLYLAENLASLHASADMQWLAGRVEFLGEKALGAALSVLAIVDEAGTYRPLPASPQAPQNAHELGAALRIGALPANERAAAVFAQVESQSGAVTCAVEDIFDVAPPEGTPARAIVVPVAYNREAIGIGLFVVDPSPLNEQVALILANHVAVAVYQLRQREEARRLHSVDPILWIPDEHFLIAQLKRELSRARRYRRELGVAVLRLENERDVRRQFGDFFTDHLMRRIGSQVVSQVRDSDVLGALGGGYAVIHNETSAAGTRLSGERLRDSVTRMIVQRFPEVPEPRVSLAVVSYPEGGDSVEELLSQLRPETAEDHAAA
ncbi:MAG: diguanylate cyclase [Dehalococcoidia bacterium]